jgi:predicted ATPase
MKLKSFRVIGFQSYEDTGEVALSDGINLIIGQNNVGKSALLRALQVPLPDNRHRNDEKWQEFRLALPRVKLCLELSGDNIHDAILRRGGNVYFPCYSINSERSKEFIEQIFHNPKFNLSVESRATQGFHSDHKPHEIFYTSSNESRAVRELIARNGEVDYFGISTGVPDHLPLLASDIWNQNMFYFQPERHSTGRSGPNSLDRLTSNADNLPAVLHQLQGNRGSLFNKLISHLREIFPTFGNLSIPTAEDNSGLFEVKIWPTQNMDKPELSFSLNSSGTGVAQVISILTAVITVEKAVIIIDEINNFLHPAATKALIRILQSQYSNHQYIIATHSPDVINHSNAESVYMVRKRGYRSEIQHVDTKNLTQIRGVAKDLGVSMTDVFSAEKIVWVEGETEENCFPLVYQSHVDVLPIGLVFISVVATGDFMSKKRDRELIYKIYLKISNAVSLFSVPTSFSFDSELLSDAEKQKMHADSNGLVRFLPRRNFECYLIDIEAISSLIEEKDPEVNKSEIKSLVKKMLVEISAETQFSISQWKGDLEDESWLQYVDGAGLISEVCARATEQRVNYSKKHDSVVLLRSILDKNPKKLAGLIEYVASLVEPKSQH